MYIRTVNFPLKETYNPALNMLRKFSCFDMFRQSAVTKEMVLLDININCFDQTYCHFDHDTGAHQTRISIILCRSVQGRQHYCDFLLTVTRHTVQIYSVTIGKRYKHKLREMSQTQ